MENQTEDKVTSNCEHDFSIIVGKQKSLFAEVVTMLACKKCGLTKRTGIYLHG